MEFPVFQPISYQGKIYRNIFTCAPSQNLYDDVCEINESKILDLLVQLTSGIDHQKNQIERTFQYGQIEDENVLRVFQKEHWSQGRFGKGNQYGVLYAAEDEITSVYESAWIAFRIGKDNVLKQGEVYTQDRRMFQVSVSTERAMDVMEQTKFLNSLVHPSDYSFCQSMGGQLVKESFQLLRTASARRTGGICTPVFSSDCIQDYRSEYYLKIYVNPGGLIDITSSREENCFNLLASSLENPYNLP